MTMALLILINILIYKHINKVYEYEVWYNKECTKFNIFTYPYMLQPREIVINSFYKLNINIILVLNFIICYTSLKLY